MTLDDFESLSRDRHSVHHYKADPIPEGLLDRLLAVAQRSPSGYNLQPTHFLSVTDPTLRPFLFKACMSQAPVLEAPAAVVFCGDRSVFKNHYEKVMAMDRSGGKITADYEKILRKYIPLAFRSGPLGFGRWVKGALPVLLSRLTPIPHFPVARLDEWLTRQAMLTAMSFMLAAQSAGLATLPMEGFDERRVKHLLNIPSSVHVTVIVTVGYAAENNREGKSRLPLGDVLHRNNWD